MLIEIKVVDGLIIPALYLLPFPVGQVSNLPEGFPWPYHPALRGYLAFDDRERDDLLAALARSAGFQPAAVPLDQPDPSLLAACQGLYTTRSEALAALAAGNPPVTLEALSASLKQIDDRVKAVEAKPAAEQAKEPVKEPA